MATDGRIAAGSEVGLGGRIPFLSSRPILGMALVVFGAKLLLIAVFASPTPFWDQWDAEAAFLYKPYLEHNLTLQALLSPHNEHRILWTRLLSLGLLELNGSWDPILQMVVNAGLHVLALIMLVKVLGRGLSETGLWILASATALLFAIPFGWENTLAGFQSEFYLLVIMSTAALDVGADAKGLSSRWWLAVSLGVASYFALASGALTLIALAVLHGGHILLRSRLGGREYAALAIMLAIPVLLLSGVPTLDKHGSLKAHSLLQFVTAAVQASAWPMSWRANFEVLHMWRHLIFNVAGTLIVNAPLLYLLYFAAIRRRDDPRIDRLIVFWVWVALQTASLAYGRAVGLDSPRYLDLIIVGVVVNVACLLFLVQSEVHRQLRQAAAAWCSIVLITVVAAGVAKLPRPIKERWHQTNQQTVNTRAFLATGDKAHLTGKPFLHIPYPVPERLALLASDPSIRSVLPRQIMPAAEVQLANNRLLLGGYLPPAFRLLAVAAFLLGGFYFAKQATPLSLWRRILTNRIPASHKNVPKLHPEKTP